jgi:DNA-binding response OmpR family regulator
MTMDATVSERERSAAAPAPRLLRVLVIDDERDATDTLSLLVHHWGHEVRWAYDASLGLKVAASYLPDVLLLDIDLPPADGCELAQQLRGDGRLKDCFMIAVTGRGDEAHRQRCRQAGIDLVLVKPVDPVILESLLTLESEYVARR